MSKKNKKRNLQPVHGAQIAQSAKQDVAATIVMTVVITVAILVAGFFIFNAIKDSSWFSKQDAVIMYEYSDFQCPFCGKAYPIINELESKYGDKLVVVFKHFPLSFHPFAQKASEASECARDQGKFKEYHNVLFENQDKLAIANLQQYALNLKLDPDQFNDCLNSGVKASIVAADMAEGQKLGVTGTPTFVINGSTIVGAQPLSTFQAAVDKALAGENAAPAVNDPIVTLTVIADETCTVCEHKKIIDVTKQQLFPTAQVVALDKEDSAAQRLISELKLTALPAYLFSQNVKEAASFSKVEGALTLVGDYYVINPGAAGPVRYTVLPSIDGKEVEGSASAPLTIVEFSDFQCPYCKKFVDDVYPTIKSKYVDTGKVKMVFMQLPLEQLHPNARNAAMASECAAEQSKFWAYHDELFKDQSKLALSDLKTAAITVGLDKTQFDSCLDSQRYSALVDTEMKVATSYGISGTPGFLINGIFIGGLLPVDSFTAILDSELGVN